MLIERVSPIEARLFYIGMIISFAFLEKVYNYTYETNYHKNHAKGLADDSLDCRPHRRKAIRGIRKIAFSRIETNTGEAAMTTGIYKITSPSGRVYIGQSWNIEKRWRDYSIKTVKGQRFLNNSFEKYGKSNHLFEILHELPQDTTQQTLNSLEVFYMDLYKADGFLLMNCRGGGSNGKLSDETKKLMSEKLKGRPSWNKGMRGVVKMSEETKRKQSEIKKGKPPNSAGKPRSKHAIEQTAMKNKGRKRTAEQLENISRSMMGKAYHGQNNGLVRTEETRLKISQSLKARTDNKGEMHNMAKLTNEQVLEIRRLYKPRIYPSRRIAREFGIAKSTVLDIVNNKLWKNL